MAEMTCRYKPGQEVSGAALTTQVLAGRFVSVTGAKTSQGDYPIAHTGAGEDAFGVAEFDTLDPSGLSGYDLRAQELRTNVVRRGAIARVVAGGAVAVGDYIASDSDGKGVEATSGDVILGRALTAATTDGDVIEVDLILAGGVVPAP